MNRMIALSCLVFSAAACTPAIERSGVVVDSISRRPLAGVRVDVYLGHLQGDSLQSPVFTDSTGWFRVSEKRPADRLFTLDKDGYIGFTGAFSTPGDTLILEPLPATGGD